MMHRRQSKAETTSAFGESPTSTQVQLSNAQRLILFQIMHHVQGTSHYGFGDVFWVNGPTVDVLGLEFGKRPHQFINDLNALIHLNCVGLESDYVEPCDTNCVCMNCEGWRQHPNFRTLLPWIAAGEQLQDWGYEPEFERISDDDIEACFASLQSTFDLSLCSLPGTKKVMTRPQGDGVVVAPSYVTRPTNRQLKWLASLVSPRSKSTCVLPGRGTASFMTANRLLDELNHLEEGRVAATLSRFAEESPHTSATHSVESAYVHTNRLYLVLDFQEQAES